MLIDEQGVAGRAESGTLDFTVSAVDIGNP